MLTQGMQSRITFKPTAYDRVSQILKEVSQAYGVTINDLRGDSRLRHIARPRQIAYVRLRDETDLSLPAIGRIMGNRDHTTILYGIRETRKRIQNGEINT
jgi:chromosomal replication initiator protein